MDYVTPQDLLNNILSAAEKKAHLSIKDMVVRGALSGALLGYATSLAFQVTTQGLPPIVGALLFPVGFVLLVLLGLELATGNFALLFKGLLAKRLDSTQMVRNWVWVYVGNLLGCLFYALLFYLAITNLGASESGTLGESLRAVAEKKTLAYMSLGTQGWMVAFVKGILCNWMVTLGAVMAFSSRSSIGKIVAMWLPIMTFFALGFEHSIVNMFVIPMGMLLGAPISIADWWLWNQIPVTLGNIASGVLLTGFALYITHQPSHAPSHSASTAPALHSETVTAS